MGNTTSCCVSSSPKLRRNAHSRLESYRPEADLSREDTGCNLQHISDRENIDGEGRRQLPPSLSLCLPLCLSSSPRWAPLPSRGAVGGSAAPPHLRGRSSPCLPRCRETAVFVLVIHGPYSLCSLLSLHAVEALLTQYLAAGSGPRAALLVGSSRHLPGGHLPERRRVGAGRTILLGALLPRPPARCLCSLRGAPLQGAAGTFSLFSSAVMLRSTAFPLVQG